MKHTETTPVKNIVLAAAIATALSSVPMGAFAASPNNDVAQIREQLEGLLKRVDKLEQENNQLKQENEELKATDEKLQANDDYLKGEAKGLRKDAAQQAVEVGKVKGADWAGKVAFTGDIRYRYEGISDETANAAGIQSTADRYRDRVRARLNATIKATDNIIVGIGFATTEGGDPRSSNQSLTGVFSRKSLDLDTAYFDWKFATWGNLIGGKMKQPFFKPGQSLFWDNDINPEGLALGFNQGIFFGSAYDYWLVETSAAENATTSDTMLYGAQFGVKLPISASSLTLAAHYYELKSGQFRSPFYLAPGATLGTGQANGNTTCTVALCGVAAPTLAFNYEVINVSAQFDTNFGALPVQFWADAAQNRDVDDLDTAWAAGVLFGKAANYRTWEVGAFYESLEKDALFAQLIDSDFAGGVSDSEGWVLKAGYTPVRNWTLNATYFLTKRNVDVANAAGVKEVDYDRLQLDFNVKF
jgi:hypothetical protein